MACLSGPSMRSLARLQRDLVVLLRCWTTSDLQIQRISFEPTQRSVKLWMRSLRTKYTQSIHEPIGVRLVLAIRIRRSLMCIGPQKPNGPALVKAGPRRSLVGTAGFELATPCTPCKCATRLRYAPKKTRLYAVPLPPLRAAAARGWTAVRPAAAVGPVQAEDPVPAAAIRWPHPRARQLPRRHRASPAPVRTAGCAHR